MSVMVFGASGFLGSWAVRALLAGGEQVHAVVRSRDAWRLAGLEARGLRIVAAPTAQWSQLVRDHRPRAVVLADWAGVSAQRRDGDDQWANLERHESIIQASVDSGVERVVGLGSQAEYGPRTSVTFEDDAVEPASVYGKAKVAALGRLRDLLADSATTWSWGRVFSVYGPLDNEGLLLPTIADKVLARVAVDLSSGQQLWSYLYAADAGRAIALLAVTAEASGIVNIGHPEAPPLRHSIEIFASTLAETPDLRFGAIPARPGLVANVQPDVSRLASLGWSPLVSRARGLETTASWLRGQEVGDPFEPDTLLPARATGRN